MVTIDLMNKVRGQGVVGRRPMVVNSKKLNLGAEQEILLRR